MKSARLRAPIVLAHGLFGFRRIGLGRLTLTTYFREIPQWLRASGNRVLVTRVHPIAGLDFRGRRLGEQIAEAFPDEPVHIIGHSMGGLDARQLLRDPDWHGRVLSVTTIGTPHLGSMLADFARLRVGRIYTLLEALGIDHRGFHDLTRENARAFHRDTPAPPSLPCFSIAGVPTHDEVCWPLRRLHAALSELEGPNDGLVSVESALAFGIPLDSSPLDHFRQMNWLPPEPTSSREPPAYALYDAVVTNLARWGFAAPEDWPVPAALAEAPVRKARPISFPLRTRLPWPLLFDHKDREILPEQAPAIEDGVASEGVDAEEPLRKLA